MSKSREAMVIIRQSLLDLIPGRREHSLLRRVLSALVVFLGELNEGSWAQGYYRPSYVMANWWLPEITLASKPKLISDCSKISVLIG
jgi:hypothetical protein